MDFNSLPRAPVMPNIPNSHAVLEKIASNQVAAHRQLMEQMTAVADLLQQQNELLAQLVQGQAGKG